MMQSDNHKKMPNAILVLGFFFNCFGISYKKSNYSNTLFFNGDYNYVLTDGTRNFNKYWIRIETGERGTNVYGYLKDADLSGPLEIRANM